MRIRWESYKHVRIRWESHETHLTLIWKSRQNHMWFSGDSQLKFFSRISFDFHNWKFQNLHRALHKVIAYGTSNLLKKISAVHDSEQLNERKKFFLGFFDSLKSLPKFKWSTFLINYIFSFLVLDFIILYTKVKN